MTLSTALSRVDALGNGSATTFSFSPVVIFEAADLQVTKRDAAGIETVVTLGTGATNFSLIPTTFPTTGSIVYPASGGTPLPTGAKLIIKRVVPLLQSTHLTNHGGYFAEVQEAEYDYLTAIDQQQQEQLNRTLQLAPTDPSVPLTLPTSAARANKMLGFDSSGNPVAAQPSSALVSTPMIPVVDAVSTAAALVLLGAAPALTPQQFGALGDGVHNDAPAFQAALTALASAGGGELIVPAGTYLVSGLNYAGAVGTSMTISGSGASTILQSNNATADLFTSNGADVMIQNVRVQALFGAQTAGWFFVFNGGKCHLKHIRIFNGFSWARWVGTVAAVIYGGGAEDVTGVAAASSGFYVDCSYASAVPGIGGQVFFRGLQFQGIPSTVGVGLQLVSGDTVIVSDSVIAGFQSNIFCHTTSSRGYLANVDFVGVAGDGAGGSTTIGNGWDFDGSSGYLSRIGLTRCWAGTMLGNGIYMKNTYSLAIIEPTIIDNGVSGIVVDTGCQDITIKGGIVTGNSQTTPNVAPGISVVGTVAGLRIQQVRSGPTQNGIAVGASNAQTYGIVIGGAGVTSYYVTDCDLRGNTSGGLQDAGTGTNGSTKFISDNMTGAYP